MDNFKDSESFRNRRKVKALPGKSNNLPKREIKPTHAIRTSITNKTLNIVHT